MTSWRYLIFFNFFFIFISIAFSSLRFLTIRHEKASTTIPLRVAVALTSLAKMQDMLIAPNRSKQILIAMQGTGEGLSLQ